MSSPGTDEIHDISGNISAKTNLARRSYSMLYEKPPSTREITWVLQNSEGRGIAVVRVGYTRDGWIADSVVFFFASSCRIASRCRGYGRDRRSLFGKTARDSDPSDRSSSKREKRTHRRMDARHWNRADVVTRRA